MTFSRNGVHHGPEGEGEQMKKRCPKRCAKPGRRHPLRNGARCAVSNHHSREALAEEFIAAGTNAG
jgi:hypothetical protein